MRRQAVAVALAAQVADGTAALQWNAETVSKETTSQRMDQEVAALVEEKRNDDWAESED
jgi:hypothetical protein